MSSKRSLKGGRIAALFCLAMTAGTVAADTVTIAPGEGETVNVAELFTGGQHLHRGLAGMP